MVSELELARRTLPEVAELASRAVPKLVPTWTVTPRESPITTKVITKRVKGREQEE
jgi:hypothetical protein